MQPIRSWPLDFILRRMSMCFSATIRPTRTPRLIRWRPVQPRIAEIRRIRRDIGCQLYINGSSRVNVIFGFFYYQGNANTHAFPVGLKMIAGGSQDPTRTFWDCFKSGHGSTTPPYCTGGKDDYLVLRLRFPDCWNGVDLGIRGNPESKRHSCNAFSMGRLTVGKLPANAFSHDHTSGGVDDGLQHPVR